MTVFNNMAVMGPVVEQRCRQPDVAENRRQLRKTDVGGNVAADAPDRLLQQISQQGIAGPAHSAAPIVINLIFKADILHLPMKRNFVSLVAATN